ncbi:hypothetical protein [Micromonospora sp. DT31]|uniref:hypothetical protein n=1 Tax=Micromonospora sp. DT31 TaxID=3393434 RepID=UPI003CE7E7AA
MRRAPLLLALAAVCAVAHVGGVLAAAPIWRGAEVLSLALLLAYAIAAGLPAPRWAVPAALVPLLIDAVRTMPAAEGPREYGWTRYEPLNRGVDVTGGFDAALTACWATLVAVAVLLVALRGGGRRRHLVAAAVAAAPIIGYAAVRIVDVGSVVVAATGSLIVEIHSRSSLERVDGAGVDRATTMATLLLVVLPPLALALGALALAVLLAGRGRRLAAAGAALLAVVALPLLDGSLSAASYSEGSTALFAWYAIAPTPAMPAPVAALTAAVELAAYLLIVAGLSGSERATMRGHRRYDGRSGR